jgi:hypothetical protein
MSFFCVMRAAGAAWSDGGITTQPAVDDHVRFMNALADQRFVHFAAHSGGASRDACARC